MKRICVYCGSETGRDEAYVNAARALGHELVDRGLQLVFGGGHVGLMGVVADAVLERDGHVIGVIPQALQERELAHPAAQEMRVVADMHERKATMSNLSDAAIAMPGGLGTLEEIFEAFTWRGLGFHDKPAALFNVNGYFDELVTFLDYATRQGFIRESSRKQIVVASDASVLLDQLLATS